MRISNLKIAHKFILGFALVLATMIATSVGIHLLLQQNGIASDSAAILAETLDGLDRANAAHLDQAHTARGYVLTDGVARHRNLYREAVSLFEATIAESREKASAYPEVVGSLDALAEASRAWRKAAGDPMIEFAADAATHEKAVGIAKAKLSSDLQAEYRTALTQARTIIAQAASAAEQADKQTRIEVSRVQVAGGIVSCLLAALMGLVLARSISGPTVAMTQMLMRLAAGDPSVPLSSVDRKDEIGDLAKAIEVFRDAAIEKSRLESEREQARVVAEKERQMREQERVEAEREQARLAVEADRQERNRERDLERSAQAKRMEIVLSELARGLEHLAEGDLTWRIESPFPAPAMEPLRVHFNDSMRQLQDVMSIVAEKAMAIGEASHEIRAATDELSGRSESQAANIEETVTALSEITRKVRASADGAGRAHEAVAGAASDASAASGIVARTTEAMGLIDQSSRQINQIVGMIDEIAFQTNLLALNAGVEAARAGDAGRGFAVVASEVRALAQRASEATKQIAQLIETSKAQVGRGVKLVDETGGALVAIAAQVAQINAVVGEIASGARDQASNLGEVNTATAMIDRMTQQTVASIDATTSAIHALSDETVALTELMSRFKVGTLRTGARDVRQRRSAA